ncbi:hypothetical protein F511_23827 [Dorcoceras hygrometricum]|uniref:Uncharacterized protein n=1 Tax=Dorcoceras hygrometricum TaxID=472368 RepID=A0A2Z7C777_9LAMI|nr:hypothetical protein F511_23827 [Dorcoceras hygrometricum]
MDNEGMVKMFKALESSGLKGFLGCSSAIYEAALVEFFQNASMRDDKVVRCSSAIYEAALVEFFQNASMRDDKVVSTVQGKFVEFTEEVFAGKFEIPTEGLTDMSDVPNDLVFDARTAFSYDGEQLNTSCQKREMKFEFRLLNDILAKTVTVKAGSFDAVTHERFLMMLPSMGAPDLELGESKDFPPLKILTAKTVGTYVAENKNITVDVDDPAELMAKVVKKKAATKKRPAATSNEPVLKKERTTVGETAPTEKDMAMVPVQKRAHVLEWQWPCCAKLFEGEHVDRGSMIDRSNTNTRSICWSRYMIKINGVWTPIEGPDRWYCMCHPSCYRKKQLVSQRSSVSILAPICVFTEPIQGLTFPPPMVKTWGWFRVCIDILQFNLFGRLQPVGTVNLCTAIIPVGPVVDRTGIPKRSVNNVQYSIQVVDSLSFPSTDSVPADPIVQIETDQNPDPIETDRFSQRNPDTVLNSPSPSTSADSLLHFTIDDIPLGDETADDQILLPTSDISATDFTESFAQLRASVIQLSFKQLRTTDSIGDLKSQLLSNIDHLEQALAEAHTQQNQVLRGLIKHVRQEVQIQKSALSLEILESKREVQAQNVILTTDLADIQNDMQDQKAALLAFREESQEHYITLPDHLAEIIAYINRGRDDKKGEIGSIRGPQPPPDDKSRPSGGGGSRSEPPRKRGSGGS